MKKDAAKKRTVARGKKWKENLKNDSAKHLLYKEKEKNRSAARRSKFSEMTDQQKAKIREQNRERKRRERLRKSGAIEASKAESLKPKSRKIEQRLRKRVERLEKQLKEEKKCTGKMTKRWQRLKKKLDPKEEKDELRENVKRIMKQGNKEIEENLLCKEVLMAQLEQNKTNMNDEKSKSLFAQCVSGKLAKKYKMMQKFSSIVSGYMQRKHLQSQDLIFCRSTKEKERLRKAMQQSVREFLEKDEHTAIAPGADDTIFKNGQTKRKRFLLDSLPNLYRKYKSESVIKVSQSTFYRFKPFWVVRRTLSSRDTCMCKLHANFDLIVQRLARLKIVRPNTLNFCSSMVCPSPKKECYYRECKNCKEYKVAVPENSESSFYYQWQTVNESRVGAQGQEINCKVTKKIRIECEVSEIVNELNEQLPTYLRHKHDTAHQHRQLDMVHKNMKENEASMVIDWSENFICKYANEIQSVHFGASKKQISLHTGAFFYKKSAEEEAQCVSFCSVCENTRHDTVGIWTHMDPVLKYLQTVVPKLDALHIQSDGPSSQYKNRTNLFMFNSKCKELKLKNATWNFTTPGHGKSVADGTGGTVKGICNRFVTYGNDVLSAEDIVQVVEKEESAVKMFLIPTDAMSDVAKQIPEEVEAIPQIQSVYQVLWDQTDSDKFHLNYLTCFECRLNPPCPHFPLKRSTFTYGQVSAVNRGRGRGRGSGRGRGRGRGRGGQGKEASTFNETEGTVELDEQLEDLTEQLTENLRGKRTARGRGRGRGRCRGRGRET